MKYLLILIFLLAGCSIDHNVHPDPVKVEPIIVNHKVQIDPTQVKAFYTPICTDDAANDTQAKIDACITKKYDEFLNALAVGNI